MTDARVFEETRGRVQSTRATILLSFGLFANLAALMTFAATLNEIAADWSLDASRSGWIGGIYFAGYAVSVPFLASATDRTGRPMALCRECVARRGGEPCVRPLRARFYPGDDLAALWRDRPRGRPYAGP
jgi:hypothetical protein